MKQPITNKNTNLLDNIDYDTKSTYRICTPPKGIFWIPKNDKTLLHLQKKRTPDWNNLFGKQPMNKYSYNEYAGIYDITCNICGGLTFSSHTIDGACYFCVLLSPHCNITIDLGESSSPKYPKAKKLFNRIRSTINIPANRRNLFLTTYDMCLCINDLQELIFIAGRWKNFNCYLGANKIKSDIIYQLLSYLRRILEVENCSCIHITNDGNLIVKY